MNWWDKLKVQVVRFGFRMLMLSGAYGGVSRLYQQFFERQRHPLKRFETLNELGDYLSTLKWRPDTWKQLWDTVSHAEHVQFLADTEPSRLVGDCDDFASYIYAVCWRQSWEFQLQNVRTATLFWYDLATKTFQGHNVALIQRDGLWAYMDYHRPLLWKGTQTAVLEDVYSRYARGGVKVGAAVHNGFQNPTIFPGYPVGYPVVG